MKKNFQQNLTSKLVQPNWYLDHTQGSFSLRQRMFTPNIPIINLRLDSLCSIRELVVAILGSAKYYACSLSALMKPNLFTVLDLKAIQKASEVNFY